MNPMTESSMINGTLVDDQSREAHASETPHHHAESSRPPKKSLAGRLFKLLMTIVVVAVGVVFGMYKMHVNIPALQTPKLYAFIDRGVEHGEHLKESVAKQLEKLFGEAEGEVHHEEHKVMITTPMAKDVVIKQEYVCQIRSQRHVAICALEEGYLMAIPVKEGQQVKEGDLLFQVRPILFQTKLDAKIAERDFAELELKYTQTLAERQGVSQKEVQLYKAKLARAEAEMLQAKAELAFTQVRAPFDGIIDRLMKQQGTLVKDGDELTSLSDNSVMWAYFNVPEKRYLEYMEETGHNKQSPDIELILANQRKFPQIGKIGAIEANFNNENGNLAFRADFPNPDRLLRHGQTGTVRINRVLNGAVVIPQRATFENLAKRYVYIVGDDNVVHQSEITIDHELEDVFVIGSGVKVKDKIVLEGIRQVHDGEKLKEYEFRNPEEVMANQKNKAE